MLLATFHTIKFSTKFFDVLGRAYGKMKANIKYYVLKEAIENKRNVALEFEVYMRIIEDSEGNDVRVFVKEDKANGLRKDSSFYADGSWEVFEMKGEAEVTLRNSLGIATSSIRDSEGKLQERILKDKDGNLVVNDKYIWKNGLLIKEIGLEGTRVYLYGKNPYEDTVRVIPSDKGHYFHKGYDGSVGMIPKKGEANYEIFLADPYGTGVFENKLKILSRRYGEYNSVPSSYLSNVIREISYRNPKRTDACAINRKSMVCPELGPNREITNGGADIDLILKLRCVDDGCGNYEIQHFENALNRRHLYTVNYIPKTSFDSFEKCEKNRLDAENYIFILWNLWKVAEDGHYNYDSPKSTTSTEEECDEIP